MSPTRSLFESFRLNYQPPLPAALTGLGTCKAAFSKPPTVQETDLIALFPKLSKQAFVRFTAARASEKTPSTPLRVGVVFSGGQAAGGHNVVSGLFDALQALHPDSVLLGFLAGPGGLVKGKYKALTAAEIASYRNLGGFDMLGSDRTKLDSSTQAKVLDHARALKLDGLVIVGGDDSNTNAAFLAEFFLAHGCNTRVVGVPKTIDGDLKGEGIEISFGFDTAAKTYSNAIGNLARDALSAKKYYYFVKLMGRTASNIALECALQTQVNYTLIGEEIAANGQTLQDVVNDLADLVVERAKRGKDYGVVLVPEGLLEFIPDCLLLIKELGALGSAALEGDVGSRLSAEARECLYSMPQAIQHQLMLDRDPHGNLQVSKIETERLLSAMVMEELKKRADKRLYSGNFNPQPLFCGYEGRACAPSSFDANYCYALGYVAAGLICNELTGYMAGVAGLSSSVEAWQPIGIPLVSLLGFEERKGVKKAVIVKSLVDLDGAPFSFFKENRALWAYEDEYRYPGPIQYFGPQELREQITCTLALESVAISAERE